MTQIMIKMDVLFVQELIKLFHVSTIRWAVKCTHKGDKSARPHVTHVAEVNP